MRIKYAVSFLEKNYPFANIRSTKHWSGTDDIENWIKNQPNRYKSTDITYVRNKQGFRSDPFETESRYRIVFTGCSQTEGIGLPLHETWSHILLERIKNALGSDIPYWNLALGGCGIDTMVRSYYHYMDILKPQVCISLVPCHSRREYKGYENEWDTYQNSIALDHYHLFTYVGRQYFTEQCLSFLDLALDRYDTLFLWDTWDVDMIKDIDMSSFKNLQDRHHHYTATSAKDKSLARDHFHHGDSWNLAYADAVWDQYKDVILARLVRPTGVDPVTLP